MDIIVSHKSAFLYWRSQIKPQLPLRRSSRTRAIDKPVPLSASLVEELASLGIVPSAKNPVDLLFATAAARNQSPLVRNHVQSHELPPGSFVRVSTHVLMASPELTFTQIASSGSMERACMLGAELCGSYTLVGSELRWTKRAPLTSAKAIHAHIAAREKGSLAPRVRWIANHLPDGAASSREARLVLLLSLPTSRGGYGLPAPVLNASISLGEEAYSIYPHTPCRLDLSWPEACFDVEYDGRDHAMRTQEDYARAAALAVEGIRVMALTNTQVADVDAFDAVARHIAAQLGVRLRVRRRDFAERQAALRRRLGYSADGLLVTEDLPEN